MNTCADNDAVMRDISLWSVVHARRNLAALQTSLEQKASSDKQNMKRFKLWHEKVLECFKAMRKELEITAR